MNESRFSSPFTKSFVNIITVVQMQFSVSVNTGINAKQFPVGIPRSQYAIVVSKIQVQAFKKPKCSDKSNRTI